MGIEMLKSSIIYCAYKERKDREKLGKWGREEGGRTVKRKSATFRVLRALFSANDIFFDRCQEALP